MNLYMLRHGIAVDKPKWKGSDSDRPLTKEGIRKMKKGAKGIRRLGVHFDWILTSPFRRAYDTAKIVAKELKLKKRLKITQMLATDGDPKALVRHLGRHFRSWESVLIVGHEPYLGRLAGVLVTGREGSGLEHDKGGISKLTTDSLAYDQSAHLEWFLSAKILKKLT
jgi:phosphohistidine phosphatase